MLLSSELAAYQRLVFVVTVTEAASRERLRSAYSGRRPIDGEVIGASDLSVRSLKISDDAFDPMLPVALLHSSRSYSRLFTLSTLISCNYGTVHASQMWPRQRHAIPKVALILP